MLPSLPNVVSLLIPSLQFVLALPSQEPLISKPLPEIPHLGFGTWNVPTSNASSVVSAALQTGYRHIDCAHIYRNEPEVGSGLTSGLHGAGLHRHDIWLTSKLWNDAHAPEAVLPALQQTLSDLQTPYLDLYLMHWPVSSVPNNTISYLPTWHAMESLLTTGLVRHIGISNFSPSQLSDLLAHSTTTPYAHQMELHPYLPQTAYLALHAEHGIHVTAYSPLGNANPTYKTRVPPLITHPLLRDIAAERGCTPAQVALAYGLGRGSVIPKSVHVERMQENFEASECGITDADRRSLEGLPVVRFNDPSGSWGVRLFQGLQGAGGVEAWGRWVGGWIGGVAGVVWRETRGLLG